MKKILFGLLTLGSISAFGTAANSAPNDKWESNFGPLTASESEKAEKCFEFINDLSDGHTRTFKFVDKVAKKIASDKDGESRFGSFIVSAVVFSPVAFMDVLISSPTQLKAIALDKGEKGSSLVEKYVLDFEIQNNESNLFRHTPTAEELQNFIAREYVNHACEFNQKGHVKWIHKGKKVFAQISTDLKDALSKHSPLELDDFDQEAIH